MTIRFPNGAEYSSQAVQAWGDGLTRKLNNISSAQGNLLVSTGFNTKLFSISLAGLYIIYAYIPNLGTPYQSVARITSDGTNVQRLDGTNGANLSISVSGSNVQVLQSSGSTQTVAYVYERLG